MKTIYSINHFKYFRGCSLIGRKSETLIDPGYVWAPYISIVSTPIIDDPYYNTWMGNVEVPTLETIRTRMELLGFAETVRYELAAVPNTLIFNNIE